MTVDREGYRRAFVADVENDLGLLGLQNDLDVVIGVRADVDVAVDISRLDGVTEIAQDLVDRCVSAFGRFLTKRGFDQLPLNS